MKYSFAILLLFISSANSLCQWQYKGLAGVTTNQLTLDGDSIYASTSNGLYCKALNSLDTNWQLIGLAGKHVVNTEFIDAARIVSIVEVSRYHSQIFLSMNRGRNYSLAHLDTAESGVYNFGPRIGKLPRYSDTLYFLHFNLKTFDGGVTWQSMNLGGNMYNDNKFICVAPDNSNDVYIGGETWILMAYALRSIDACQTWGSVNTTTYFVGDNAILDMTIADDDIFTCGEGVVVHKKRTDSVWTQLFNKHSGPDPTWALYFFSIALSPVNSNYLYVSGQGYTPSTDKVRLLTSVDKGGTWDSLSYDPGLMLPIYGIHDITIQRSGGNDIAWLGGTGVYTYTRSVPVSIDNVTLHPSTVDIHPNPAMDRVIVCSSNQISSLEVVNTLGQVILRLGNLSTTSVDLDISMFNQGVYWIRLNNSITKYIIKM